MGCKTCGNGLVWNDRQYITELKNRYECTGKEVYVYWNESGGMVVSDQINIKSINKRKLEYFHIKEFNFV